MKFSKLAVVLLGVPAVLGTNEMRRVYRRQGNGGILPVPSPQSPTGSNTSTTPTSTSTTPTSTSTTPTSTTPPTTTPPTTTPPTTTKPTTTSPTTTSQTTKTSLLTTTDEEGNAVTRTVTTRLDITPTSTPTDPPASDPPPSNSKATIIGLSVAGGIALLGVVAFIIWKMKQKRFSQFDDEDPGAIKWPEASPEVNRSTAAAEAGVAARPTADPYGTHATNSTVELDPYSVPPLPQGGYRDDPNIQAGGYYDPYRGPVPGTFASPSQSHDGHTGAPWGAPGGEAIPMSVRRGTPGPPGPGGYDDFRRGSPAPYGGGGAPSIRRGPSPGPNFAGGPPDYGRGSPAPPPNFNRPPANVAYDDPYGGTA